MMPRVQVSKLCLGISCEAHLLDPTSVRVRAKVIGPDEARRTLRRFFKLQLQSRGREGRCLLL